jgi:hypothetical protein
VASRQYVILSETGFPARASPLQLQQSFGIPSDSRTADRQHRVICHGCLFGRHNLLSVDSSTNLRDVLRFFPSRSLSQGSSCLCHSLHVVSSCNHEGMCGNCVLRLHNENEVFTAWSFVSLEISAYVTMMESCALLSVVQYSTEACTPVQCKPIFVWLMMPPSRYAFDHLDVAWSSSFVSQTCLANSPKPSTYRLR